MGIKTSDGISLSKMDTMYFQSAVQATSDSMCHLIKYSGVSVAVFVTFAAKDESAKENSFIDLGGLISDALPKPKVSSFPYIYRCGDYFGEPDDVVLFTKINPEKLYGPLLQVKAALCQMWDLFATYQSSVDLRYCMAYVVTDVVGFTKAGLRALDLHDVCDVRQAYSPLKDAIFQEALHKIEKMHRDAISNGQTPYYTVR